MTFQILSAMIALQQGPQGPSPYGSLFMFGMIALIFYFLMIRPQQQQRKSHESALRNLHRGDRVVTAGGIIADVIHIKEAVVDGKPQAMMDDEITVKSGETRLIVERGRIAKITTPGGAVSDAPKEKKGEN